MLDRTSKRLSRALVLDRSIEFLAQVTDQDQQDQQDQQDRRRAQQFHSSESRESLIKPEDDNVPPPDRGSKAVLFMISAFIIEAIMWGFPLTSAGVFTTFYNNLPLFQNDRYVAVIATLGTGIPFLGAPIITPLTARWHDYRQEMIWVGWVTCMGSLVAASFSTTVWQLIITQGLGYGIGFLVLYYAMLDMLNEWYVERRGLAYGVLFAAAGLSGTGLPFLTEYLLEQFGYAWTLRICAVSMLVLIGPTLPFCRGRLPPRADAHVARKERKIEYRAVLRNPVFYFFTLSNLFQGLAFYLPGIYLSLYAWSLNISTFPSVLLLCLLNLAQVIGQVASGYLSDTSSIFVLIAVSTLGSALACFFWYFAEGLVLLALFSVFYGIFAGGYSVFFSRFVSALTNDPTTSLWLYGIFAFQRGLGNVAAGPLSALLLEKLTRQPMANMPTTSVPVPMTNSTMSSLMSSASPTDALALGFRRLIIAVGGGLLLAVLGGFGWFYRQHVLPVPSKDKSTAATAPPIPKRQGSKRQQPPATDISLYPMPLEKRKPVWIKEKTISVVTERAASREGNTNSDWT